MSKRLRSVVVVVLLAMGSVFFAPVPSAQAATMRYVALGDSYSTGIGVADLVTTINPLNPKEWQWDFDPSNALIDNCYRTKQAYPRVLTQSGYMGPNSYATGPVLQLANADFRACQGDYMADVIDATPATGPVLSHDRWIRQHPTHPVQSSILNSSVDVITLTVGGQNMGFVDIAKACAPQPGAGKCSTLIGNSQKIVSDPSFVSDLTMVYQVIRSKAPNAVLYVLGYPDPVGPTAKHICLYSDIDGSAEDALALELVMNTLNGDIKKAVDNTGDPMVKYVNVNNLDANLGAVSQFPAHTFCSSSTWINRVNVADAIVAGIMPMVHPNEAGNKEQARLTALTMLATPSVDALHDINAYARANASVLGAVSGRPYKFAGGVAQDMARGGSWILWAPQIGAHYAFGAIGPYIVQNISSTGFPTTDEYNWQTGRAQAVANGGWVVWSTTSKGAHRMAGPTGDYINSPVGFAKTGFPTSDPYSFAGGLKQDVENGGSVLWKSAVMGAHYAFGAIGNYIVQNITKTGFPTSDEYTLGAGRAQDVENGGRVVWSPTTPAYYEHGAIGHYIELNFATTGFPTSDEYTFASGRAQDVKNGGRVVWSPSTPACYAYGAIGDYIKLNITKTGFPTRDEYTFASGRAQDVANGGRVLWTSGTGAYYAGGAIGSYIIQNIASTGFPTTDEYNWQTGRAQTVSKGGWVVWSTKSNGAHRMVAPIGDYINSPAGFAKTGFPTSDPYSFGGGLAQDVEKGGWVFWKSAAIGPHYAGGSIGMYIATHVGTTGFPIDEISSDSKGQWQGTEKGAVFYTYSTGAVTFYKDL